MTSNPAALLLALAALPGLGLRAVQPGLPDGFRAPTTVLAPSRALTLPQPIDPVAPAPLALLGPLTARDENRVFRGETLRVYALPAARRPLVDARTPLQFTLRVDNRPVDLARGSTDPWKPLGDAMLMNLRNALNVVPTSPIQLVVNVYDHPWFGKGGFLRFTPSLRVEACLVRDGQAFQGVQVGRKLAQVESPVGMPPDPGPLALLGDALSFDLLSAAGFLPLPSTNPDSW